MVFVTLMQLVLFFSLKPFTNLYLLLWSSEVSSYVAFKHPLSSKSPLTSTGLMSRLITVVSKLSF